MAKESRLWAWLAKVRQAQSNQRPFVERIENLVGKGTPDVHGTYGGSHFWIELKSAKRPARGTTPVRFPTRECQVEWHNDFSSAGGRSFWLVQVGEGAARSIYMIEGKHGPALHEGLTETELAAINVLPSAKPTPLEVVSSASW
jgi:hypothetical protein